jgi:hypothetical protein
VCPFREPEAQRLWSKACNYHRGRDLGHDCGNPDACMRTLREAVRVEGIVEIECQEIGVHNIDYWEGWQGGMR